MSVLYFASRFEEALFPKLTSFKKMNPVLKEKAVVLGATHGGVASIRASVAVVEFPETGFLPENDS